MYSVEKLFMNKFNDPMQMCLSCSCFPYPDNHYHSTNTFGNKLNGILWRPYSMLQSNLLFRKKADSKNDSARMTVKIDLYDIRGKLITSTSSINVMEETLSNITEGAYVIRTLYSDGTLKSQKKMVSGY